MLKTLKNLWQLKDLRKKILVTTIILLIVRVIDQIPLPGIQTNQLQEFFSSNQLLGLLDIFSGGSLSRFSIGFMGVGPYITASIIMQLMTYIIPSLEDLQKEGEYGKNKINQYTRLLTVPMSIIQSFGLISLLKNQGVIVELTPLILGLSILVSTATSVFYMWLGENISESGIGNGISLIITINIIGGMPSQINNTISAITAGGIIDSTMLNGLFIFAVTSILTIFFIVIMNDAIRKIPISYARQSSFKTSGQIIDTYLPIKVNIAGVIPIIFALSFIVIPGILGRYLQNAKSEYLVNFSKTLVRIFDPNHIFYGISYFILVILFTYFYSSIVFKPKDVAENLQKQGGFIPGIRPGKETENFVSYVLNRITLPGSIFLGIIAISPFLVQKYTHITTLVLGGTSILILVSVILDTSSQIKAHLISRSYEIY
ncbi:MAG: Protein translocase subunit SecY [Berkelbacteria bacterium GW2011_GWA2_35_9]|uniref:Protein translocase subunit SecY n=1 Tax=Berkelbacteria bacterium GW2011_GWA2_35_9 TaxID=1618333 RepID=A0A0G0FP72_9BACT|nr:MAG: Protein translocase subunit SecY [Berkelbacteria bacterium GW2011_GWA2_35_9]